jgi:hypothetical protein
LIHKDTDDKECKTKAPAERGYQKNTGNYDAAREQKSH